MLPCAAAADGEGWERGQEGRGDFCFGGVGERHLEEAQGVEGAGWMHSAGLQESTRCA